MKQNFHINYKNKRYTIYSGFGGFGGLADNCPYKYMSLNMRKCIPAMTWTQKEDPAECLATKQRNLVGAPSIHPYILQYS